jgi:dienelactone hydrolase
MTTTEENYKKNGHVKKCLKTSLQLIISQTHKDCGQVGVVGFCFEADCQYDGG